MSNQHTLIINGRFLSQRMTGVHRYAYEMTRALQQIGVDLLVVAPLQLHSSYQICFPIIQVGKHHSHLWEQFTLPHFVRRNYPDSTILSFTGIGPIVYPKTISTIHDMSFLANPRWFTKSYYYFYRLLTPIMARRAERIITVSQFSKQEIVQRLNIPASKVIVAYNAVSDQVKGEKPATIERPYLLAVSSLDSRKNLNRLVQAFERSNHGNCQLYIVGASHPSFREGGIPKNTDESVVFKGYVGGTELANLYAGALAAIYPSLYEGFGLPNLEAMLNSCPVVTSAIAPHHEVCADAALYFDPYDVDDMTRAIDQIISQLTIRQSLLNAAGKRLQLFSWQQSAQIIKDVLNL